jgi:hypothetical protein
VPPVEESSDIAVPAHAPLLLCFARRRRAHESGAERAGKLAALCLRDQPMTMSRYFWLRCWQPANLFKSASARDTFRPSC